MEARRRLLEAGWAGRLRLQRRLDYDGGYNQIHPSLVRGSSAGRGRELFMYSCLQLPPQQQRQQPGSLGEYFTEDKFYPIPASFCFAFLSLCFL